jgi:hypothetical protein
MTAASLMQDIMALRSGPTSMSARIDPSWQSEDLSKSGGAIVSPSSSIITGRRRLGYQMCGLVSHTYG